MRVLMTADGVGGVFGFAVDLARELCARGVEVELAVMGEPLAPHQRAALRGVRGLELHERKCALEWMSDPWADVDAAGEWLGELARRHRPALVHLNGYAHAALEFGAPKLVVAHSCVRGWWRAVHGEAAPARYAEYTRRVGAGLDGADAVVAPTRAMLATLAEEYGFRGGDVIPNGIDHGLFRAEHKQAYYVAAGRFWDPAKNLELIAGAAERLPWPVRIAGDCGERPRGAGRAQLLGALGRSELASHFAGASVLLHPARYEPFGLVPLEAAVSGCALVLGDIPSLREVWGDAASYVAPNDADALLDAARRLATDADERRELAARALARARANTASAMASRYLGAYQRLTRSHPRAAQKESSAHAAVAVGKGIMP
jgi:glycosyltransferase involved in cell wall biosynthesis